MAERRRCIDICNGWLLQFEDKNPELTSTPQEWATGAILDIIEHIEAGTSPQHTETEWQPIETAPLDGTDVLVWFDFATVPIVHIAWYRSAEEWERSGQYTGGWDSLEDWEGWWSYTENSVSQSKLEGFTAPTHWMPLPQPPQAPK